MTRPTLIVMDAPGGGPRVRITNGEITSLTPGAAEAAVALYEVNDAGNYAYYPDADVGIADNLYQQGYRYVLRDIQPAKREKPEDIY